MVNEYAVIVRSAHKRYGLERSILNGLNLTVQKGSIYGLLGASGCGKTTLLSCVVGVRKLDTGDIWVLGGRPGSPKSGVPGSRVGYMPQDIALCNEFTVIGALYYFGRINNMEVHDIEERYLFLKDLLQLPPKNHMIKDMSGGQQRRVSFAAALLHKPELLILDEPTVGLDPVLRDNIWNFLIKVTAEEKTTVIITTHYIEEARQAHTIGLLRQGILLAESSPAQLLERYQTDSLEEAFLSLSQMQGELQDTTDSPVIQPDINTITVHNAFEENNNIARKDVPQGSHRTLRKMRALLQKNFMQFVRNPGGCVFAICLPLLQVTAFFAAVGGDPKGLKLFVVNDEAGDCNNGTNWGNISYDAKEFTCSFHDISCRFVNGFGDSIAKQVFHEDLDDALHSIKKSHVVGVMHYSRNFSRALESRLGNVLAANERDVIASQIPVWLDMGDRQIGLHMQKKLFERFFEIFEDVMRECQISEKFADVPLRFEEPIYGSKDQNYAQFVAPSYILTLVFFLATAVCTSIIITDRHEGLWDRSLVQGVKTSEILFAHFITQLMIVIIQVAVTLATSFLIFRLECKGSFAIVLLLVFLNGICGMSYGLLLSALCSTHTLAHFLTSGTFYPILLLSGCIWPLEGMPKVLRWISMILPTTVPGISLRAIVDKGLSIDDPSIYTGFLVILGWTALLLGLCLYNLRTKTA